MARFIKTAPRFGFRFIFCGIGFIFCGIARAQTASNRLTELPNAPLLPPFRWLASTDSKHQNNDFVLLQPGETRRVTLAAGQIERLWSTALFPDQLELKLETAQRRSQLLLSSGKAVRGFFTDKTYTFFPDLTRDSFQLGKSVTLVATNRAKEANKWFFQIAVRPKTANSTKNEGKLFKTAKPIARRNFKLDLASGEGKIVTQFDKPGQIEELSFAADVAGAKTFRNLQLQISCDGQKTVEAPLLSLAGEIAGEEPFQNAVADFHGSRLVLRWPMPFGKAQISLRNAGDAALKLDVGARVRSFDEAPSPFRFCAVQLEKTPQKGRPVEILNVKSAGALVGLAVDFAPAATSTRRAFAYLEGNEQIRADGKLFEGTGTEDFFSSAWYFPDKPFFRAYEGMSRKTASPPSVAAYRFLIPDSIPFGQSLRFDFEHGNGNNAPDIRWKFAAFWYQKLPIALPVSDARDSLQNADSTTVEGKPPVAPGDRWKLGAAVGAGVLLGIAMRFSKRRRAG